MFTTADCYKFIYDYSRTNTYDSYLQANASGKTIVDCGGGSGILTYLALQYGASHVYCLENDNDIYNHLVETFSGNSKVTVQNLDCTTDTLPTGDIYLHEFFGSLLWDEGIQGFIDNLNSQSITNIFPSTIEIFNVTNLNRIIDWDASVNTDYAAQLSQHSRDFLDAVDLQGKCPWYTHVVTYSSITHDSKTTSFNGSILDLTSTYHDRYYWEVSTEYGTFGNLNLNSTCWHYWG